MQGSSKNKIDKVVTWCSKVSLFSTDTTIQKAGEIPALAVLHVRIGSSLKQGLSYFCHATHYFCSVFFGAERADQVKWSFNRTNCGGIYLSQVAN